MRRIILCGLLLGCAALGADYIVDSERLDEYRECFPIRSAEAHVRLVDTLRRKNNWGRELVFDSSGCWSGYTRLVAN